MKTMICHGLDGGNPLHALAAFGVFRLLALRDQEARMRWLWTGGWRPEFVWKHGEEDDPLELAARWLAEWLRDLGSVETADPQLTQQVVNTLNAKLNKDRKTRKDMAKVAKAKAKRLLLRGREAKEYEKKTLLDIDTSIARQEKILAEAQQRQNDALGQGIAHLGDKIGVQAPIFRRKATMAVSGYLAGHVSELKPCRNEPALTVEALAAQGSDGIREGDSVQYTPFSFSNGAGGQLLLKDFRKCAAACTEEVVCGTLTGQPVVLKTITGLNWNPADQRSYALQWNNPESGVAEDPAVNALAFVGLSLFPAMPVNGKLWATGWKESARVQKFVWPLWHDLIGIDELRGLLAQGPDLVDEDAVARSARGISAMFIAKKINPTGKRNYFAPARTI